MKTNTIVGIAVVIAIAVAGYFLWKDDVQVNSIANSVAESGTVEEQDTASASGKKMAFSQFVKQGGSYKCSVNQNVGGTQSQGITYISGGMIRGEYNTQAQGLSIDTTVIVRDGYSHTWTSMAPSMGFKAKVVDGQGDTGAGASGTYSFNADQIGDYDCVEWSADASMFALPAGVSFKEI